jgi:hypothetical protein
MKTRSILGLWLMLLVPMASVHAATPVANGATGTENSSSAWPADVMQRADEVLRQNPGASTAREERRRAEQVLQILRGHDVQLYRSSFMVDLGNTDSNADLYRAAVGDVSAAMRVARHYCGDGRQPASDPRRCIGWLQLATKLGSGTAAYELALHYRRQDQPLVASNYEAQAVSLGFSPPNSLDNVRK